MTHDCLNVGRIIPGPSIARRQRATRAAAIDDSRNLRHPVPGNHDVDQDLGRISGRIIPYAIIRRAYHRASRDVGDGQGGRADAGWRGLPGKRVGAARLLEHGRCGGMISTIARRGRRRVDHAGISHLAMRLSNRKARRGDIERCGESHSSALAASRSPSAVRILMRRPFSSTSPSRSN